MYVITRLLAAQWSTTVAVGVATLLFQTVLARGLGPAEFGLFSVATAIASVVLVVQSGGYRALLLREGVRATSGLPTLHMLHACALGHVVVTTAILLAAALAAVLVGSTLAMPVALLLAVNAPRIAAGLVSTQLLARGAIAEEACWQALARVVPFVAAAVIAMIGASLNKVLATLLAAQTLVLGLRPTGTFGWAVEFRSCDKALTASFGIFVVELVTQLYTRQSMLVLYVLSIPAEEIGRLGILMRMLEFYTVLLGPLVVLFHNLVRSHELDDPRTWQLGMAIVAGGSAAVMLGFGLSTLVGGDLLAIIFGVGYRPAAALLPWLVMAALVIVPNMLMSQVLIARGQEWSYFRIAAAMVPFNLALNLLLIQSKGTKGAVIAMMATETVLGLLMLRRIMRT